VVDGTRWITGANEPGKHVYDLVGGPRLHPDGTIEAAEIRDGDQCPNAAAARWRSPAASRSATSSSSAASTPRRSELKVLDENGKQVVVTMGSYGIGVSRAVAAIAEQTCDELGLCWPREVAPADVHIVATGKDDAVFAAARR
jgi:prolyl-tRNA synthetase